MCNIKTPEYSAAAAQILCSSISSASSSQKNPKRCASEKQGALGDEIHRKMEWKIWREMELRKRLWCRAPGCQTAEEAALNPLVAADHWSHTSHMSHVTSHTSYATRHTSHVTRHTSHATYHTSHVTRHTSYATRHTSHATRHTSHVTRHTPHVTRHTPHVTRERHSPPAAQPMGSSTQAHRTGRKQA